MLASRGEVVSSRLDTALPCVIVPGPRAREELRSLRAALPPGLVAFLGEYSEKPRIGAGPVVYFYELVLGRGQDQFAIPALAGTRADFDLDGCLRRWHARHGLEIVRASHNQLCFELLQLPPDLGAFVTELYHVCPDPIDVGWAQCPEVWEEMIQAERAVGLWWR